jgi:alkylation response protein AidB-like acyl-CoA dehydrogenase
MEDIPVSDVAVEQFRSECVAFLEAHADRRNSPGVGAWGEGSDVVALYEELDDAAEQAKLATATAWRRARFDAGLGWISGPIELGGRGLSGTHEREYDRLEAGYEAPEQGCFGVGLGMVAPTILEHGTEMAKRAYVRSLYRADRIGCQLFSEPGSGSDLASVSTRAIRDGDAWVITGQKVWTSGAHYSDIGEILCRTDPDAPKHKGLSAFVVDMPARGVEVRRVRQMTGGSSFNEVFFDEVRVPDSDRLGEVNGGWRVALTTLMNERASIGGTRAQGGLTAARRRLTELLQRTGQADDPVLRQELMKLYTGFTLSRWTSQRAMAGIRAGRPPGPELSIGKLTLTQNLTRTGDFVGRVLGARMCADTHEWGTFAWANFVCGTPGARIAGGSDEVMRNIVAERVLGLPKDDPPSAGASRKP